jgi:hypothetical protein
MRRSTWSVSAWLIREEEKRVLMCNNNLQRAKCITNEEEYILWGDRIGRMVGGIKEEAKEDKYAE